ncbi:MAG: hypothetical protein PHZ28_00435 [Candidatus Izemoplasmatales bacterium]|nr:hypothetical protein [Candidatus Izemoplasmatales bacterium]
MKKLFFLIIGIYLVVGSILILTMKEKATVVNYFTIKQNYSRLMTENETLFVSLFIDSDESFITHTQNIASSSLKNEDSLIAVDILRIDKNDGDIVYSGRSYSLYNLEIDFTQIKVTDLFLGMKDCFLTINYVNDVSLELEIGDVWLDFREINPSNHFDYNNLYAVINDFEGSDYINALVFRFESLTNFPITIKNIRTLDSNYSFDLNSVYVSEEKIAPQTLLTEIIPDYEMFNEVDQGEFLLESEYYYVIPMVYREKSKIYRFPIIIDYSYNDSDYTLIIDDYLFFDEMIDLNEQSDKIREYQYHYQ